MLNRLQTVWQEESETFINHSDHVFLLRGGVPETGGRWADFGSGAGAFTLALAELVGPDGEIYSVDRDRRALREQEEAMHKRFPDARVHYISADFTLPLDIPPLDGLVIANALHFHRRKEPVVELLKSYLRPAGRFLLVEYNVDQGNYWVPHPISYSSWESMAKRCGFAQTRFLASRPSRFLREIYSSESR